MTSNKRLYFDGDQITMWTREFLTELPSRDGVVRNLTSDALVEIRGFQRFYFKFIRLPKKLTLP